MGRFEQLYLELKRRRVFRALLAWGIFAFAVLQVVDPVLRALDAKDWVLKAVVAALAVGFPVTAVLSWLYDLTSKGITRTPPADTELAATPQRAAPRSAMPDPPSSPAGLSPRGNRGDGPDRPGPLSILIEELAQAPGDTLLSAWKHELRAGDTVGRFKIVRELGKGGFGAVYEAQDSELGRHVALKTLQPRRTGKELSADWIRREAEAVARLDHPCIVTLFDVGSSAGGPYLVMELLRGETLAQRLESGPLSIDDALQVARQVARALAHAHKRGILHRDLKPANVFVCEDGRVKLLDFGLAHLLGTRGADGSGTPAYMAPEQARGEDIDARADVFSAALMLRETMTGRRDPPGAAELPRGVARSLEKALSTNREDRPRDGTAWLEDVVAAQQAAERPRKVARVGAIAFAGIAVAAGLAFAAWRHGRGSAPTTDAANPSVAVLAFADMSPGKDQGYLADGVAEEVLNGLAQVDGLRVVGRTTSFSYKGKDKKVEEIGRELGVGAVLDGSVRKSGDRVRITAQLVRTSNASTIWSQSFERSLSDVFAVQDEIGKAVVEALAVRLLPGKSIARTGGTINPEALQLYLRGRELLRRGALESPRALESFEKAVVADPRFALAWVAIADAIVTIEATMGHLEGDPAARRRRAREAADRAVAMAPGLPDAYRARADVHLWLETDWRGQRADLDRALSLAPGDPAVALSNGFSLQANGRLDDAIAEFERVVRIDPLLDTGWLNGWLGLGAAQVSRGNHEAARASLRRALELFPSYCEPRWGLGMSFVTAGVPEEALAEARRARKACPYQGYALGMEALAHHDLGHPAEARAAFDEIVREYGDKGAEYQVAEIHAWRGEADQAFAWLEKARAKRDTAMFWLKTDPLLMKIRGDPRWAALLRRADLPPDGPEPVKAEPQPPAASIAVLPFADMSPKHDQEYFADGVAEEILNALARVDGLKIVGRTSSFSLRGKTDDLDAIGRKLGVANVLEGSVRREGNQVRVTAKLIRVADGAQLWSERYDRKVAGILKVQDEIASAVVGALAPRLVAAARPGPLGPHAVNPDAYAAYLLGRHLLARFTREDSLRAVGALEKAVALDPGFAPAWGGLSMALEEAAGWQPTLEALMQDRRRALEAANRAVALGPDVADGYLARANLVDIRGWDWTGSIADARRAVEIAPRDATARCTLGMLLVETGKSVEGLAEMKRATEFDPLSVPTWGQLGWMAGGIDPDLSRRAFDRAREIAPSNDYSSLGTGRGSRDWAAAILRKRPAPGDPVAMMDRVDAYRALGKEAEARKALDELVACCSHNGAWQIAIVYDELGDRDRAFEWLDRAREQMDQGVRVLKKARRFKGDPRTAEILRKMNLPPD